MPEAKVSLRVAAPAAKVWEVVGDFAALHQWVPGVAAVAVEGEGVGAIRSLTLQDGKVVQERLETDDPEGRSYSYTMLHSPLAFENYLATFRVVEDGGDACTVHWDCTFDRVIGPADDVAKTIGALHREALEKLRALLEKA